MFSLGLSTTFDKLDMVFPRGHVNEYRLLKEQQGQ